MLVVTVLLASGCGDSDDDVVASAPTATVVDVVTAAEPAAVTVLVPPPATGEGSEPRQPPARLVAARAGEVRIEEGPFTDRVQVQDLRLTRGERPRVTGSLLNRVDVSELIVLELRADFYDASGTLVGSGRQVFEDVHEAHEHPLEFTVRTDRPAEGAVAALLSVPQLVNE